MASKKFNKNDERLLRAYADKMPIVFHNTHEVHYMTGAEILDFGHVVKEGEKLDPEKKYAYNMPVQLAANHYRRLKRAWLKNGEEGIKQYVSHIAQLALNQKQAAVQ
jgi:hypothetical protein